MPLVKHNSIEQISLTQGVKVSVIIPHFYDTRKENLEALLEDLRQQTFKGLEIIVVRGVSPQGKVINDGVRVSHGEALVIIDDDARIGHDRVIENLVRVLTKDPTVGMAGASVLTPDTANRFQKAAARRFPEIFL